MVVATNLPNNARKAALFRKTQATPDTGGFPAPVAAPAPAAAPAPVAAPTPPAVPSQTGYLDAAVKHPTPPVATPAPVATQPQVAVWPLWNPSGATAPATTPAPVATPIKIGDFEYTPKYPKTAEELAALDKEFKALKALSQTPWEKAQITPEMLAYKEYAQKVGMYDTPMSYEQWKYFWDLRGAGETAPPPGGGGTNPPPGGGGGTNPPPGGGTNPPPGTDQNSRWEDIAAILGSRYNFDASRGVGQMPGFTGSPQGYMAGQAGFAGTNWDPSMRQIDPGTETIEGRMARMLQEDNPYLMAAQSRAQQIANSRGLLNSSIAAGAGTNAAMQAALPIATQDAQAYLQQGLANQQFQNQAGQFNANTQNQLNVAGYQAFLQSGEADRQAQRQAEINKQSKQLESNLMILDEDIKSRLSSLQQDYAVELETLKQSYQIMENRDTQMGTMYSEALNSIAGFLNRAELTPQQQSAGVKVIIDNLNAGLQFMAGIAGPTVVNEYKSTTSYVPPSN